MSQAYGHTRRRNAAPFAGWWSRVMATIIDSVPVYAVGYLVIRSLGSVSEKQYLVRGDATDAAPREVTGPSLSLPIAGFAMIIGFSFVWYAYNAVYRQGRTGQSIGKTVLGIALYREGTIEPIGPLAAFVRLFVHLVDSLPCNLGYLWPLWDNQKRTFTDMIMSARVYHASTLSRL